jgi:hypothetical protein
MGDERALSAIARIEHALARIEAAAKPSPALAGSSGDSDEGLREAHEALKGKVGEAIARIDRLLAEAG